MPSHSQMTTNNSTSTQSNSVTSPKPASAWSKPLPPPSKPSPQSTQPPNPAPSHQMQLNRQLHFGSIPAATPLDLSLPPRTQSAPPNLDEFNNPVIVASPSSLSTTSSLTNTMISATQEKTPTAQSAIVAKPSPKIDSVPIIKVNDALPESEAAPRPSAEQPQPSTTRLTHNAPSFYPRGMPMMPPNISSGYVPPGMVPFYAQPYSNVPMMARPPIQPIFTPQAYVPPPSNATPSLSSFVAQPKRPSKAITIKNPETGEAVQLGRDVPIFNKPPASATVTISEPSTAAKPLEQVEKKVQDEQLTEQPKEEKEQSKEEKEQPKEEKEQSKEEKEQSKAEEKVMAADPIIDDLVQSLKTVKIENKDLSDIEYPSNSVYSKELLLSFQQFDFVFDDKKPLVPDTVTELLAPEYTGSLSSRSGASGRMHGGYSSRPRSRYDIKRSSRPVSYSRPRSRIYDSYGAEAGELLLPVTENRWMRPNAKASSTMDTIFRLVKGCLNKLTAENFDRITRKMLESISPVLQILKQAYPRLEQQILNPGTQVEISDEQKEKEEEATAIMSGIIQVIFDKAVDEPNFSPLYSMVCTRIVQNEDLPTIPMRMANTGAIQPISLFKRILLTTCQEAFERKVAWTKDRMEKEKEQATSTPAESNGNTEEAEYQRLKLKRRTLGNISFIGHLYNQGLLREQIIHNCIQDLLSSTEEEEIECCCKMITTSGHILDTEQAQKVMNAYFRRLKELSENMPSRIKFMIMDLIDLRTAGWDKKRATAIGKETMNPTQSEQSRSPNPSVNSNSSISTNHSGPGRRSMASMEAPPGLEPPMRGQRYSGRSQRVVTRVESDRSSRGSVSRQPREDDGFRRDKRYDRTRSAGYEEPFQPVSRGGPKRPESSATPSVASSTTLFKSANSFSVLMTSEDDVKEAVNVQSALRSIIEESPNDKELEEVTDTLLKEKASELDRVIYDGMVMVLDKHMKEVEKLGRYMGGWLIKGMVGGKEWAQMVAKAITRLFEVYSDWKEDVPKLDGVIGALLYEMTEALYTKVGEESVTVIEKVLDVIGGAPVGCAVQITEEWLRRAASAEGYRSVLSKAVNGSLLDKLGAPAEQLKQYL